MRGTRRCCSLIVSIIRAVNRRLVTKKVALSATLRPWLNHIVSRKDGVVCSVTSSYITRHSSQNQTISWPLEATVQQRFQNCESCCICVTCCSSYFSEWLQLFIFQSWSCWNNSALEKQEIFWRKISKQHKALKYPTCNTPKLLEDNKEAKLIFWSSTTLWRHTDSGTIATFPLKLTSSMNLNHRRKRRK